MLQPDARWAAIVGQILLLCGGDGTLWAATSLEPCSVYSAEEAQNALDGPVKQDVPSPIKYKGISTGGTCMYRLVKEPYSSITIRTDATPTGAQKQRFEAGLRRVAGTEISGIGDRAYTETYDRGPQRVTFLRGDTLTTVTVDDGVGIEVAKHVAAQVAARLPDAIDLPSSAGTAPSQGSGKLDAAVVGSWFMKDPSGRALANLYVNRDGTFSLMLIAGGRQQQGAIDADNGVLHLYPERGGNAQMIRYRFVDPNEMEWIDTYGTVTRVRRQFH